MGEIRVAFWNVKDLFEPGADRERGPRDEVELEAKVSAIAQALAGLFGGSGPDLIGLAEIHTPRILDLLCRRLAGPYRVLWEACRTSSYPLTGLAVLARGESFLSLDRVAAYSGPTTFGRPRFLVSKCTLTGTGGSFFFVINHWRSRRRVAGTDDRRDRLETARALGDWLAASPRDMCAIVIGDFNAEPFERPFGDFGLCSTRHFGPGLRLPHPHLYNTAWRFLAEPDPSETVTRAGTAYEASRPRTTFAGYDPPSVVFDQLLVSGRALRGGPVTLREASVGYACDERIGYREHGYLRPRRWTFQAGAPSGVSDHFPLIATFDTPTHGERP